MEDFSKILMRVFHSIITTVGYKVYAEHVEIGRNGIETLVSESLSNRTDKDTRKREIHACIVASVMQLLTVGEFSDDGASANKQWIRDNRPHFTMSFEDFNIAFPGNSHPRSRWNSKRKSLANIEDSKIENIGIVITDDKAHIGFVPIK